MPPAVKGRGPSRAAGGPLLAALATGGLLEGTGAPPKIRLAAVSPVPREWQPACTGPRAIQLSTNDFGFSERVEYPPGYAERAATAPLALSREREGELGSGP